MLLRKSASLYYGMCGKTVYGICHMILQDRFAEVRATPPIDQQQDWRLVTAEEQDGYTILEFSRKLITCDDRDLDITVSC